jgi:hypothetical protein
MLDGESLGCRYGVSLLRIRSRTRRRHRRIARIKC